MGKRRTWVGAGILFLWWATAAHAAVTRYVSLAPGCGGRSPCHGSIQAAVDAAGAGDTIEIQAGTYREQVSIAGKNRDPAATEGSRILLRADPGAAPGSVVLRGAGGACSQGPAVQIQQSRFVTIRGLLITGASGAAIALMGGGNQNRAVHIERNRIVANGAPACNGGIVIGRGNPDTLILNNLIHGNGRNGIALTDADGGPHDVIGNTIHGNGWDGVRVGKQHDALLANNAITGNGTASTHVGVSREDSSGPDRAGIQLLHNLICGNRSGEIRGPVLDSTDGGNLTPTGGEGPGIVPSPGCQVLASLYAHAEGPDGQPHTVDDRFIPLPGSPLVDRGVDPRTLGLPATHHPLLEADFLGEGARPQAPDPSRAALFDIGAIELAPADAGPPAVSFAEPSAGAMVRDTVTVRAEASDDTGIAALLLGVAGRPLAADLAPAPPAVALAAIAPWDTRGLPDGLHTLTADAIDLHGHHASAERVVIVDNTPPDTTITEGPAGTLTGTAATVVFTGGDNVSAPGELVFAWRLDGGPFTGFSPATTAALGGLAAGQHTFEVKARDRAGNEDPTPAARAFAVSIPGLHVTITEPVAGAAVPAGPLVVRGTVAADELEVGVTVNGVAAAVDQGAFAAVVWVGTDDTALVAVATAASGATATATVAVGVTPGPPDLALLLTASPAIGAAPLDVSFSVGPLAPGATVEVDLESDGVVDFTGPTLEGVTFRYAQPGVYLPTVTVVDGLGGRQAAQTVVQVADAATLDAQLTAKWAAMKTALRAGDIPAALTFVSSRSRARYEPLLQVLAPSLGGIDTILPDIAVDQIAGREAFYDMERTDDGVPLVFEIRFAVDEDGIWRVRSF